MALSVSAVSAQAVKRKAAVPHAATAQSREAKIVALAQKNVRDKLKDPDSANFRNVELHAGAKPEAGSVYVCGEVNSKNSYGGYVGFRPFMTLVFWDEAKGSGIAGLSLVGDDDPSVLREFSADKCVN
jgi:hypothetical protein